MRNPVVAMFRFMLTATGMGLRLLMLAGAILLILHPEVLTMIDKFDVSAFGINDAYIAPMLIAVLLFGTLTAWTVRKGWYREALDGAIAKGTATSAADFPYDKRYDAATMMAYIVGMAAGICATPMVVDYLFIGAGMWTHVITAGVLTIATEYVLMLCSHYGVKEGLVKAKKTVADAVDAVQDVAGQPKQ